MEPKEEKMISSQPEIKEKSEPKSLPKKSFWKRLRLFLALFLAKVIVALGKIGQKDFSTLPGWIAYSVYPDILEEFAGKCAKIVLVTGTNGKTTTNNLIYTMAKAAGFKALANLKGANLITGIISAFISGGEDHYDLATLEVDEASFPKVTRYLQPDWVVISNFSRDQLDRYGELDRTAGYIYDALSSCLDTTLILNADDPLVARMGDLNLQSVYYGVAENIFSKEEGTVVESRFCPCCNARLNYFYYNVGQAGGFACPDCGFKNPSYDYYISDISYSSFFKFNFHTPTALYPDVKFKYDGFYNLYNVCAALALVSEAKIGMETALDALEQFHYHLGRMESFEMDGQKIHLILVKNPVGYMEVLNTITKDAEDKVLLLVLNDNAADGYDVSWIWDVDFEILNQIPKIKKVYCAGKRYLDLAVRLKYADFDPSKTEAVADLAEAFQRTVRENVPAIYILPTYTALFKIREMLIKEKEKTTNGNKDHPPLS